MDRETFLSRVGRASLTSVLPEAPRLLPWRTEDEADHSGLFRARAQAAHAVLHGPVSRHGVPRVVTAIATGHDASSFVAWDHLPAPGVAAGLMSSGLERVDHEVPWEGRLEHNMAQFGVDLGVTGADAGLAESGSLVLTHGEGRPRMASLIPEVHVALLETSSIVRTLAHWARNNPRLASETTNLVIVTGPSRTGDIEQQLNLGVHGPRHVHIVMIR